MMAAQGRSFDPELQTIIENTYGILGRHSTAKYCANERIIKELLDRLDKNHRLVLTGVCGSGKTTLATRVMSRYISKHPDFTPVIINKPSQWNRVAGTNGNYFVFLDDILGKINLDRKELESWEKFFDMIFSCTERANYRVIVGIRTLVMKKAEKTLKEFNLFQKENVVNMSSSEFELKRQEKADMVKHYCKEHGIQLLKDGESRARNSEEKHRTLTHEDITQIAKTKPLLGFPMACHLFFSYENFFNHGVDFFKNAKKLLHAEIDGFKRKDSAIYSYLAYIMFCGGPNFVVDSEINMEFLTDISSSIHEETPSLTDMHEAMEHIDGIFIRALSDDSRASQSMRCLITFSHEVILEAVISSFGRNFPEVFLRLGSNTLIKEFGRSVDQLQQPNEIVVNIPKELNKVFARAVVSKFQWVTDHPSYDVESFVPYLLDEMEATHRFSRNKNSKFENLFRRACKGLGRNMCREIISRYGYGNKALLLPFAGPTLSPSFFDSQITHAFENDLVDVVTLFLDLKVLDIKTGSKTIRSPVVYASKHCSRCITEYLLQQGVSAADSDVDGRTVVHYAARNGWTNILEEIISKDAGVLNKTDKQGMTPSLFSASLISQQSCKLSQQKDINASLCGCEYLLSKKANVHTMDKDGKTLLHYVVRNGWTSLIDKILELDSDMLHVTDKYEMSPLLFAASLKRRIHGKNVPLFEMPMAQKGCRYIVDTREVDLLCKDSYGRTLVHYLTANGWTELLDELLLEHPTMCNATDDSGQTPLVFAASHNCERSECMDSLYRGIKFMIQRGVDFQITDNNGRSILHHLVTRGMVELMDAVLKLTGSPDDKALLLNLADIHGQSAAIYAISKEYSGTREQEAAIHGCKYLLQKGADLHLVDKNGRNILHFLAKKGVIELMEVVLSKNKELLDKQDYKGRTPILFASCELCRVAELESSAQGCRYLLQKNADIKIKDKEGRSFKYWCKSNSKWSKDWARLLKQCT